MLRGDHICQTVTSFAVCSSTPLCVCAHTVCVWSVSTLRSSSVCVGAVMEYWCPLTFIRGRLWWPRGRLWWLRGRLWWPRGRLWWLRGRLWWLRGRPWWLRGRLWWPRGRLWWLRGGLWLGSPFCECKE